MQFAYNLKLNFKKMRKRKRSAMFLALPIGFLVCLIIIISSQIKNVRGAMGVAVFGTVEEQNTLIELTKDFSQYEMRGFGMSEEDLYYTENDLDQIEGIDHVIETQILTSAPVGSARSTDIFEDNSLVTISRLTPLQDDLAGLYTDEDFSYTQGEIIPLILNAQNFIEVYEDWDGQDSITINRGTMRERGVPGEQGNPSEIESSMPIKSRVLDYDKNELLGKEISLEFGYLSDLQTFEMSMSSTGMIISKLSEEEISQAENSREEAISQYWNYDKLTEPLTFTFRIVGIIENETNSNSFVPQSFVDDLMEQYIRRQLEARNDQEIALDELGSIYNGLEYDGLELSGGMSGMVRMGGGMMGMSMGGGRPGSTNESSSESYTIPGLVLEIERDSDSSSSVFQMQSSEVLGEYTDPEVYLDSVQNGQTILVKIDEIFHREEVIEELNDLGYAYHDFSNTDVFAELESSLSLISWLSVVAYVGLSIIIIVFTMSKFIAESRKEIGIFRAVGATMEDIRQIFMGQAVLYSLVGYIWGSLLGLILNLIVAVPLFHWFNSFIQKTVGESFGVINEVELSVFQNIDEVSFAIYSFVLLLITILVSIIPAGRAAKISPVKAIRGE